MWRPHYLLGRIRGCALGGTSLRFGIVITGVAALAWSGAGAELAPAGVTLPNPATAKIVTPASVSLAGMGDEVRVLDLAKAFHLSTATGGQLTTLQIRAALRSPAPEAAAPLMLAASSPHAAEASVNWDLSRWGSLGLTTESAQRSPTLLGDFNPQPLSLSSDAKVSSAGITANVGMGDGWVTSFSYSADISQLDLKAGASPALATSSVQGRSYGVSITKRGLFGDTDALGISVSRPSDSYFGSISLAGVGLEDRGRLLQQYPGVALGNGAHETDVALGYVTTFFNGALALQANAGYQMNAGGQSGTNSVAVVSRAKINF